MRSVGVEWGGFHLGTNRAMTHERLREVVGDRAYRYLRRGGLLQIWRQSSPHNWFINTKAGDTLWHSADRPRQLPNLRLFELVSNSTATVPDYWGSDRGKPSLSLYRLRSRLDLCVGCSSELVVEEELQRGLCPQCDYDC